MPDRSERVKVKFGVEYGTDIDKVKNIVLGLIKNDSTILKDPEPAIIFDEMGDFALKFTAYFWIGEVKDKMKAKDNINTKIYNALRQNNIGIPFPTRTVYMKNI